MEAESDELQENVRVVRFIVVKERRRLVGYDCSILCCEARQIIGAKCRLDEYYYSLFRVKDIVEAIDVDEYGAGVLCLGGIEDVSVSTWTEIWWCCIIAFWRESLYRSYISIIVGYLRYDVAGAGKVVVSMSHIGLALYPKPEKGGSTGHRYQYSSFKVVEYHHDLLATTTFTKRPI